MEHRIYHLMKHELHALNDVRFRFSNNPSKSRKFSCWASLLFMKMMRKWFIVCSLFFAMAVSSIAADITITVKGVRNAKGRIAVLAFVDDKGFPDRVTEAKTQSIVPARAGEVTLLLKDVPQGKVALTVLHDEDGDGKLKRNMIGIPTEGVGMSGKPLGNRAPKFEDAVVEIQGDQKREIVLKYW